VEAFSAEIIEGFEMTFCEVDVVTSKQRSSSAVEESYTTWEAANMLDCIVRLHHECAPCHVEGIEIQSFLVAGTGAPHAS
jgi:hypothetical protein